jgi:hypothetical protein
MAGLVMGHYSLGLNPWSGAFVQVRGGLGALEAIRSLVAQRDMASVQVIALRARAVVAERDGPGRR